jgi:hypothetical protein
VFTDFDHAKFMQNIQQINSTEWIGTHCWPGKLPLHEFEKIICVTTSTHRSKCYRWVRSYHHQFQPLWKECNLDPVQMADKMRETAKNYIRAFDPVFAQNVVNIEFAEIVENTADFQTLLNLRQIDSHMQRWQQINSFLYDRDVWNSEPVKAMHQAEIETHLQRPYIYE